MYFPFQLPKVPGYSEEPVWENGSFMLGNTRHKVIKYSQNDMGWNDDLTILHEESATETHPIDMASRKQAISQVRHFCKKKQPVILEIGCSSGYFLKDLQKNFPEAFIIGSDVIPDKLELLADDLTNIPLMQFDLTNCPLPEESVDVLIMLNVLEHIERDLEALIQAQRILKPGGLLILEVPAGPHLFDVYDKFLKHFRRYTLSELKSKVISSGLTIQHKSHLGVFPYPLFYCIKKKNQRLLQLQEDEQKEVVSRVIKQSAKSPLLRLLMFLELWLGQYIAYPFGIRCIMTCRK